MKILQSFIGNSSYLYGPFLYLFVFYLTVNVPAFKRKRLLHFLPFTIFFLFECYMILAGPHIPRFNADIFELVQFEILVIQILTYNVMAIKRVDKYDQSILATYSNIEQRDLRWLRFILLIITFIYVFSFLLSHLLLFGVHQVANLFPIVQIAITCCIYLMSYLVLLKPGLFTLPIVNIVNSEENLPTLVIANAAAVEGETVASSRYKKSGLRPEQAKQYLEQLQSLMNDRKPYKNPDLNIQALAGQLQISKNHLTQVLNEDLKMNFFEFINFHRIEEAKRLLLDPGYSHLSLQGIANESGYQSKTTFFANFRKITGLTPQKWSKSMQKPDQPD
jgi:AraC-like DNA-binding protein